MRSVRKMLDFLYRALGAVIVVNAVLFVFVWINSGGD